MAEDPTADVLRKAKIYRTKCIRFESDAHVKGPVVWFAGYKGTFGWSAYRSDGSFKDNPNEDEIKAALELAGDVRLVDRGDWDE